MKKNVGKSLAILLSASCLAGIFAGCEGKKESNKEQTETGSKITFTVGFDAEFPPYGYKDGDEYVGFDLDLAKEVCEINGWTLVKQPIDWDSKDLELDSGMIDCIWNGFTINGREDLYTWSAPYVDNSQVVVVKSESDIKTPADLAGKVVMVQSDSAALAAFTDGATEENKALAESFKELQQVADYTTAFMNLESGFADAVCMDVGVAKYMVEEKGEGFVILDETISSETYGIGFKLGNTELRDKVESALQVLLADGTFDEIAKKWGLEDSVCLEADDTYILGEEKIFTVGFDAEFPPYGYKDGDEYVGFDLDLAEEVCKRNGWTLVKQPIDWDSKDLELDSGMIDCIWNGFTMNGREELYTWSSAYVDNSQVVVVKKGSEIKTPADLAGKVVMVQSDSAALAAFTDGATEENKALAESFKELQQVADYTTAFMNLEAGFADAVCMDIGVAKYMVSEKGDGFVILEETISSETYGVGFKLGNKTLRNRVEETLQEMLEDGTFEEIAKKWKLEDSVCLGEEGSDAIMKAEDKDTVTTDKVEKKEDKIDYWYIIKQLAEGMKSTLAIFFLTILFSMPLGLLITFIRMSKNVILRSIAKVYISVLRGTPLMLQLLVVFFGPYYLLGMEMSSDYRFYAVIIGFSLNYAAYFAEIYRAGIEAVPVGQHEAASVLGYSKIQKFTKIIFPQMIKRVMPPVTNEVITLVKDTSLAFALAYTEMFTVAKQIVADMANVVPLFVAGIFYYVFNFVVAYVMEKIEKKMSYYK